jgi:hypothetical protein
MTNLVILVPMRADIWLGIVTVFMAVLGGIVSAYALTTTRLKVTYVALFVIAGAASVWLVIRISNENSASHAALTNALSNLGYSTKEIARMTELNTSLQQKLLGQDARISKLAEESFRTITGADSFPYVAFQPAAYPGPVGLFVWDHGKYMLTGVTLTIRRLDDFSLVGNPIDLGVLHPGWGKPLSTAIVPSPDPKTGEDIYTIEMYTQSDVFTEVVHFRKSKDGKFWAYQFWVQQSKFGERTEKPTPRPKLPRPIPKGGSVSFTVYDRSKWSDEPQDNKPKN